MPSVGRLMRRLALMAVASLAMLPACGLTGSGGASGITIEADVNYTAKTCDGVAREFGNFFDTAVRRFAVGGDSGIRYSREPLGTEEEHRHLIYTRLHVAHIVSLRDTIRGQGLDCDSAAIFDVMEPELSDETKQLVVERTGALRRSPDSAPTYADWQLYMRKLLTDLLRGKPVP